jgi:hypothetical protein
LEEAIKNVWKEIQLDPMLYRKVESTVIEDVMSDDSHSHAASPTGAITDMHLHDLTEEQKQEVYKKLIELKRTSRWLPDSSITTYFGKPAFHAYGNGNTRPADKSLCYGTHMKTHNVNPHSGGNIPKFSQVHGRALLGKTVTVRGPPT